MLDELATVDWIEKSSVAALREGVIEKMELRLGDPAFKDKPIGYLHRETAELTVAKSQVQANMTGAIEKGKAAKEVAVSTVARNKRLNDAKPGMVSAEDVAKAEGELKVAVAQIQEAEEQKAVAKAELDLAEAGPQGAHDRRPLRRRRDQADEEPGRERPGQRGGRGDRQALEAVRQRLRPAQACLQGREGQIVEIRPRVDSLEGGKEEIESLSFRGKITFVDPQIQAVAETARRIRAEFDNPDFKLMPGLKVQMTIYLTNDVAARIPQPGAR